MGNIAIVQASSCGDHIGEKKEKKKRKSKTPNTVSVQCKKLSKQVDRYDGGLVCSEVQQRWINIAAGS